VNKGNHKRASRKLKEEKVIKPRIKEGEKGSKRLAETHQN
jgi:hypothetical protein